MSQMNYLNGFSHFNSKIIICNNEVELVNKFIKLVNDYDPEIICGYEVNLFWNITKVVLQ